MDLTTEEVIELNVETLEPDVDVEDVVQVIEVETVDEINIEMDESIGWVGGDSTRHYSLYGREEADQHPITAITGLREELNDIEALDVVYSDERNQADYYLWEDENILQENRVGYFVSAGSDINEIKMCTSENDIFGVTVDKAGFIGAQSDIARDIKYGLVVTTGIVHVRCESSVETGDYVVSNDYGYAQKNKNGYKVVGRHLIDGVEYAEITLTTPINRICKLSDDVENVGQRMDDAENNIVAAINVANAAYNKAGEIGEVSEEAIKNALEALDKANSSSEKTDNFEERLSNSNALAEEAKNIALLATTTAAGIANAAVETSNTALESVNNLIDDLEPINTWTDPETGNTGAEYFTTYVKDGVATKAEIQTVETLTNDNKAAIEKSAEEFSSFVSSVDKYSVGEYSQSYGLTHEQAKSILKDGMIYVPTKHKDARSHSETFSDTEETNEFTPGAYYIWNNNDWVEYSNSVAFFSEEPTPSRVLQYWYIDSNEAPEGYEAHALYIWKDEQWQKVNILDGNVNNRLTSMIRQTADKIAFDVVNAQGDIASHQEWLDNNSANIQDVVSWKSDVENDVSQIATIKQTADDAGASVALVVAEKDGEKVVNAASIVTAINGGDSSIVIDADHVDISGIDVSLKGQTINISADDVLGIQSPYFSVNTDGNMYATGGTIGGWQITNESLRKDIDIEDHSVYKKSSFVINAGTTYHHPLDPSVADDVIVCSLTKNDGSVEYPFSLWKDGTLNCTRANIGSFTVNKGGFGDVSRLGTSGSGIWFSPNPAVGSYYINCANYSDDSKYFRVGQDGCIQASGGTIGGWTLSNHNTYGVFYSAASGNGVGMSTSININDPAFWAGLNNWGNNPWQKPSGATDEWYNHCKFYVRHDGYLHATWGDFSDGITIGGTNITTGSLKSLYSYATGGSGTPINQIDATKGSIGGWTISDSITPDGYSTKIKAIYGASADGKVYLTPAGVYASYRDEYGDNVDDYLTWREIFISVRKSQ